MNMIKFKRITFVVLIVGFISTATMYAASPAAFAAKNIRQKFIEAVQSPRDLQNIISPGEVEVLFKVNDDGSINIRKMESTNEEIENFVRDKITNIPCKEYSFLYNQYYKVKFRFQPD
jgi:hypothetical protein